MRHAISVTRLAVALLLASTSPLWIAAQDHDHHNQPRYRLIDLGTFGGPSSRLFGFTRPINSKGTVTGCADTDLPDPNLAHQHPLFGGDFYIQHSYAVKNGFRRLLEALPGGANTCTQWMNDPGTIVGFSDIAPVDPLTGFQQIRAVLWSKDGNVHDLGTLGGNGSVAWAINNAGQVTGNALNDIPDNFNYNGDFGIVGGTQTHAFLWHDGVMQDLGTLGGPDSGPYDINERGQVVGLAATDSVANPSGLPTIHPFFWDGRKMIDLGSLGGTYGLAVALNNRGQVIGNSNRAGDNPVESHAFLWPGPDGKMIDLPTLGGTRTEAQAINDIGDVTGASRLPGGTDFHPVLWSKDRIFDLGVVPGDTCAEGMAMNSRRQIVGYSNYQCHGAHSHGFFWEEGILFDLNKLAVNPGDLTIIEGVYITERGEIAGNAVTPNGNHHAVLLIPCDKDHPDLRACDHSAVDEEQRNQEN